MDPKNILKLFAVNAGAEDSKPFWSCGKKKRPPQCYAMLHMQEISRTWIGQHQNLTQTNWFETTLCLQISNYESEKSIANTTSLLWSYGKCLCWANQPVVNMPTNDTNAQRWKCTISWRALPMLFTHGGYCQYSTFHLRHSLQGSQTKIVPTTEPELQNGC